MSTTSGISPNKSVDSSVNEEEASISNETRDTWLRDSSNRETYNRNTEFTSQYYNQFLSNVSTLWTVNDQRKLKALHNLHHRRIEYHNNIHTKEGKIDLPRRESNNADRTTTSPMFSDEIEDQVAKSEITIAYAVHFYPTTSGIESSNLFQIHTLTFGQIDKFCQSINDGLANTSKRGTKDTSYRPFSGSEYSSTNDGMAAGDDTGNETATSANGFTWIHLKDLLALTTIAEHFDIHDLIVQGFSDLRTHSAILPCIGEALMSIITCCNVGNDFKMYKLYIYLSKNLVLTFQAEILPDIAKMDITPSENIVGPIFENFMKLRKKCVQLGPAYLVYELALQALRLWDSSLEYISYALFYFHKIVHLKLLHREKLEMMIKMNIIYAGAIMFQNCINEANNVFGMLVSALLGAVDGGETISKTNSGSGRKASSKMNGLGKNSNQGNHFNRVASFSSTVNNDIEPSQLHVNGSGLRRYLVPHIFQDDVHTPYFLDLADAFLFTDSCLQSIVEDLGRVSNELDATIQLRTANTSITLSLVATIFLPLTFFAGVFGMNFTVDGGYTIPLLNMKHGPAVFDILCIVSAFVSVTVFVYEGWFDIEFVTRPIQRLFHSSAIRIDDTNSAEKPLAEERALVEETRRKEEALRRRSFGKAARNLEVFHQRQTMASMTIDPDSSPAPSLRASVFSTSMSMSIPLKSLKSNRKVPPNGGKLK